MQADDLHKDLNQLWSMIEACAHALPSVPNPSPFLPASFSHTLDPNQAAAAGHNRGPLRVLAPAGSGKTRTLTARIAALVQGGIPADRILALAFNAKAAEEMRERLQEISIRGVEARTFHSLGYEILRTAHGWRYDPSNERRLEELIRRILAEHLSLPDHPGEARRMLESGAGLLREAKSALLPLDHLVLEDGETNQPIENAFLHVLAEQEAQGLLTFADMIYFAVRVLVEDSQVRVRLQQQFEYFLVDEFQDLNRSQMLFIRILALPQNNLFVVGDDDQLIYAWRGAELDHILHFERFYPSSGSVVLATNYRSGSRIVRHGRWLIEHNPERVRKDIQARAGAPPGRLDIYLHQTLTGQAAAAVRWMKAKREELDLEWSDFGLLFRINQEARPLESALAEAGIPFTPSGEDDPASGDPAPKIRPGCASLLTIHKAKGMEFPCVVVFNLSRRGGAAHAEDDERRVAYVGLTRAKDYLLITASTDQPSPFLLEAALNPAYADFAEAYLQRVLARAYRRRMLQERRLRTLLGSYRRMPGPEELRARYNEDLASDIEPLATELHFREVLGVEKRP